MVTVNLSFPDAYQLTLQHIDPLPTEMCALSECLGRVAAENIYSKVDSPSVDVSFKDGYAVRSNDVANACPEQPVVLRVSGFAVAGQEHPFAVGPGTAVRIMSGAALPEGADAVVAEEFSYLQGEQVYLTRDARPGRNIIPRGSDVACGQFLLPAGICLRPAQLGLAASAGLAEVKVYQQPRVAIISTGDEVLAPGMPLKNGKLFASNLVTLDAWCRQLGMQVTTQVQPDDPVQIETSLRECLATHNAVLTSGGAWNSERDLMIRILEKLGWTQVYHRVKIGPGKAIGFGSLHGKPIFCLPGGPPSNYMAFINLALPGLMRLGGYRDPGLPEVTVQLAEDVQGDIDWTQFVQGRFEQGDGSTRFRPLPATARLKMLAAAEGVLVIPEGVDHYKAGDMLRVRILAMQRDPGILI